MIHRRTIITLFAVIFVAFSTKAVESARCNRTCGTKKGDHKDVPYPFGFSHGCKIRLNCSDGDIRIGAYKVQNITEENILINIPAECNRRIQETSQLFSRNYALTWQNGLMLKDCASSLDSCRIPSTAVKAQFESHTCGLPSDNISCYSSADSRLDFATYEELEHTGCRFLFTSIAVYGSNNLDRNSTVSLQFQAAELGWWLNGLCQCSAHADCKNVLLPDRKPRFRCRCKEGYEGDGFAQGHSCRRRCWNKHNLPVTNVLGDETTLKCQNWNSMNTFSDCSASKYITGRCGGSARFGVLIGGIIAGALLMAAVSLICYCIRRRFISLRNLMSARRLVSEAAGCSGVPFYPYREIERATNSFSEKQRLGTGAYGTVYAGKLHNDECVAIKKIRHRDINGIEQVMNEIKLLSSVSHPNLVRLLGCCVENGEQILVYEFMPKGTLSQHLQSEKGKGLPWTIRLTIATETANAIAYLHSVVNPPIYHRDIKSSNILLDYNFKSKVADFGLSRLGMTDDSHISTAPQGTPGYVDPQYHQNFHLSDKSDVYSFGVVLVEIITALKVVDFSRPHSEVNLAALAIDRIGKGHVDEIIDPFLDPDRDAWTLSSIHKVAELAFRCLSFHRDMRPSMMEVAEELEQIRLSGWAPMEENICMASSVASTCSSPYNGSEKSQGGILIKKAVAGSQRLIVPQRPADCLTSLEELKDSSPVSVQDPWQSEHSSPSTNSLLGNVAR